MTLAARGVGIEVHSVTPLLEVFDIRASLAFYQDILGFDVVHSHEPDGHLYWVMLKLGGAVIMLNARYEDHRRPPQEDKARDAGHADTELFFDCADVDAVYMHLKQKGCAVKVPQTAFYGMKQVWVTDPDGFRICFQQAA